MQISSLSFHNIIIISVDNLKRLEGVFIPGKPVNCYVLHGCNELHANLSPPNGPKQRLGQFPQVPRTRR